MNEMTLLRRLDAIQPPDLDQARGRAVVNVSMRFASSRESARIRVYRGFPQTRGVGRPTFVVGALALCLALASLSLFTQPGRAVTSWVGDRIGLGQPGAHPSLRQLRHVWTRGTSAEGQPAYVLAVGRAPGAGRYEYITYWPHETLHRRHGGRWTLGEPCFELDLTQERSSYGGGCGVLSEGPNLAALGVAGNAAPGDELFALSGQASMAVASVEATHDGRPFVSLELQPIPAELVERLHLGKRFQLFIGFVRAKLGGGTVVVTARDASGRVLARHPVALPNIVLAQQGICESARRILKEGREKKPLALRNLHYSCQGVDFGER